MNEISEALEIQVKAIQQSLGNIGNSVNDIQINSLPEITSIPEGNRRDLLQNKWNSIRDHLESIANDIKDGRTRARYTRIDRRNYLDFIEALISDHVIKANPGKYREALEIWKKYKNGRTTPSNNDAARMEVLARELAPHSAAVPEN